MLKQKSKLGLADVAVAKRQISYPFLEKVNRLIDWQNIEKTINQQYSKGKRLDGRPAYPGLMLFKICMIKEWYNLPLNRLYFAVGDSISLTHFAGLSLDDEVPSPSTIHTFKSELLRKDIFNKLREEVSNTLADAGFQISKGRIRQAALIKKSVKEK